MDTLGKTCQQLRQDDMGKMLSKQDYALFPLIDTPAKTCQQLWQDYMFLTKDMGKMLSKQDYALFFRLMQQREQLQKVIEETPDDGFKASPEGRKLLASIAQEDKFVLQKAKMHRDVQRNRLQQQNSIDDAYNGAPASSGRRLDFQR